ncbi:DDE-type integrase/transposase/recombinase [Gilliamella sp. B14384H2]|uniref:DDE-type integrase/transposase/recombinase n=1 Tax=unclassified Gilliamella TaxID=2685620 RepID=UPI0018DB942F|nr:MULTISPECIES: DDE-type integrase/transposase/recombinase [unclassified Gilliamella]MBI0036708.1 DDE-type integrase/transposase/recombinase [Gilliamella sp. B14384G10]MBI0040681.1 DDE-type integrase/transposase/recombinase [Gilliamella sp. B14384G7]MBI0050703.1 DDE-type integrase/transposase/recombinase [Gilliamella sp. B14384G13]MBI0052995.1 DDE-type integrase/transposase/recombinase [Gilliamella sp. B14384H2]
MITPSIRDYLNNVAKKLDSVGHGQRGPILDEAQEFLGFSRQTIYRQLKQVCGWSSERKARADKGRMTVSSESLLALAAMNRESIRDNGKQTMFTTTARGILEQNGHEINVSNATLNRLMRQRKLNVNAQKVANPVQSLRALHPNHVHEIDPSLCLIYYMKNKQHIMRDRDFYKNKLENYAKVKYKVWRYTLYDRASGMIIPWYVEAAGENQHSLFQFLMFAWGKQDGRLFHGVPKLLYWDKGSANTSSAIKNLLDHLEVKYLEHEAGNARAKGGVENANNIIETQFESRLKFQPISSIEELNHAAMNWAEAYNANRLPGQDTRLRRIGLSEPVSRQTLWQHITAEQLRILPAVDVCKALMASREQERQVKADLTISFKHPQADSSLIYSLKGLDGIAVKDKVSVRSLVYGDCAIQIEVPRYDGEALIYRVEPDRNFDKFGQRLDAPAIGEEYKSKGDTEIEQAAKAMDQVAYPDMTEDEIKKAKQKQVAPFGGKLNTLSYLEDINHPAYFEQKGSEIDTPEHLKPATTTLTLTAALMRITSEIGRKLTTDENKWLSARYNDGVPEDSLDSLIHTFKTPIAVGDGTTGIFRSVK